MSSVTIARATLLLNVQLVQHVKRSKLMSFTWRRNCRLVYFLFSLEQRMFCSCNWASEGKKNTLVDTCRLQWHPGRKDNNWAAKCTIKCLPWSKGQVSRRKLAFHCALFTVEQQLCCNVPVRAVKSRFGVECISTLHSQLNIRSTWEVLSVEKEKQSLVLCECAQASQHGRGLEVDEDCSAQSKCALTLQMSNKYYMLRKDNRQWRHQQLLYSVSHNLITNGDGWCCDDQEKDTSTLPMEKATRHEKSGPCLMSQIHFIEIKWVLDVQRWHRVQGRKWMFVLFVLSGQDDQFNHENCKRWWLGTGSVWSSPMSRPVLCVPQCFAPSDRQHCWLLTQGSSLQYWQKVSLNCCLPEQLFRKECNLIGGQQWGWKSTATLTYAWLWL